MSPLELQRDFLARLAEQNAEVGRNLWRLRQRAFQSAGVPERSGFTPRAPLRRMPGEMRFLGDSVVFAGLIAFFISAAGLAATNLVWPQMSRAVRLPLDLVAIAAGVATFLLARTRDRLSVKPVEPPDGEAEDPLWELADLAERSAHRLKQGYRAHMTLAVSVMVMLLGLVAWAVVLMVVGYSRYGVLLGLSALLTAALVSVNWRPFGRARDVLRLADEAKESAALLGLTLATVDRIADEQFRREAQWREVARTLVGVERPRTR